MKILDSKYRFEIDSLYGIYKELISLGDVKIKGSKGCYSVASLASKIVELGSILYRERSLPREKKNDFPRNHDLREMVVLACNNYLSQLEENIRNGRAVGPPKFKTRPRRPL